MGPSARLRYLRMAPRKVRLIVDLIRDGNQNTPYISFLKFQKSPRHNENLVF